MTSYSKKITITASDLTSEPVWADPKGEFVPIPGLREMAQDSIPFGIGDPKQTRYVIVGLIAVIILFLIIKAINGFPLVILPLMASGFCLFVYSTIAFGLQRALDNLPKIRGLQQGSIALDPVEKANLIARLEGNWKIQPLQAAPNETRGQKNVAFTDVLVRGDKMILSGGFHNKDQTTAVKNQTERVGKKRKKRRRPTETTAVKNQTEEQTIRPYRAPDGTIYFDNFGSIIISESSDGGEVELDNAMGFKFLWQRGWKQIAGGAPTGAAAVVTTTPVTAMPTSTTGVATEISALKRLMDQGILT
eukprot:CAMPEP_0113642276 /NCGR_PEP_ID=MMETSP0017_2-20120614/22207_1 /TAXON_ID=2856 /ORGANISM="Cylindrotheca closterium" /LENGTH=304 /DNA_ID=CAMNT_0000553687 /DNA_START=24 /DNA_END=934 /DNA_ORIENTATION=+ /assembly_acc=CAM_ASM_000147